MNLLTEARPRELAGEALKATMRYPGSCAKIREDQSGRKIQELIRDINEVKNIENPAIIELKPASKQMAVKYQPITLNEKDFEDRQHKLFECWRNEALEKCDLDEDPQGFIEDGIYNISAYQKQKTKILVLLKEAYNSEKDRGSAWNLCESLSRLPSAGCTFNRPADWIWGINNATGGICPDYDWWLGADKGDYTQCDKNRNTIFNYSAFMNIKKYGGKKTSSYDDLLKHTKRHITLLREQIELIAPDIIICGNTYCYLCEVFPQLSSENKKGWSLLPTKKQTIGVIAVNHPAQLGISAANRYAEIKDLYAKYYNEAFAK